MVKCVNRLPFLTLQAKCIAYSKANLFLAVCLVLCSPCFPQEQPLPEDTEQTTPVDIKPESKSVPDTLLIPLSSVPLPPVKPKEFATPILDKAASKPEAQDAGGSGNSDEESLKSVDDVMDMSVPLPPLKPQFDYPLPPSMEPPKADEKDEEGEEESAASGVEKQVDSVELACIKPEVMDIVKKAGIFFHAIPIITSGYRARGRRGSMHRLCKAVDFTVPGVSTHTLANYLKALPEAGGVGTYCHTKSVHIDVGEPRNWGYCGFRRTYFNLR